MMWKNRPNKPFPSKLLMVMGFITAIETLTMTEGLYTVASHLCLLSLSQSKDRNPEKTCLLGGRETVPERGQVGSVVWLSFHGEENAAPCHVWEAQSPRSCPAADGEVAGLAQREKPCSI